jgi:virginiamycin B lyase
MRRSRPVALVAAALLLAGCAAPHVDETPTAAATAPAVTPTLPPPATTPTATAEPSPGASTAPTSPASDYAFEEYDVPPGNGPHDVAPAPDGTVWYTAQAAGLLGRLNPETGSAAQILLGPGSAPHGVIVGPDGAPWITDAGLNAIVQVDPLTHFGLGTNRRVGLNTAAFDGSGALWFTGQGGGVYGRLVPDTGEMEVFDAPGGAGPYGITATPAGDIWFVSLAGSYLARIDAATGEATVLQPPTAGQGARRVWSDSHGRLWLSEWEAGQLGMYDPAADEWREWRLPGPAPRPYAVYVDELDLVWLSDFNSNSLVRFDPATETFESFPIPTAGAAVRQLNGREGELWGAESATDKLFVLRRSGN